MGAETHRGLDPDGVHNIRDNVEDESEYDPQRNCENSPVRGFLDRALHDAFGETESNTEHGDQQRKQPRVSPARSLAVDEGRFTDRPGEKGPGEPGNGKIEPCLKNIELIASGLKVSLGKLFEEL